MKAPFSSAALIAAFAGTFAAGMLAARLIPVSNAPAREASAIPSAQDNASRQEAAAPVSRPRESSPPVSAFPRNSSRASESLDAILAQRDPRERLRNLQAFIGTIPPSGFADALKRLRLITNSNERELAQRLLVAHWVQSDPDGALQFAAGNRGYEYLAQDVFQQFAADNPESALARAQAIPGEELRYRALRGVLSHKADTDPLGALELAKTLGAFSRAEPLASAVYRQWAASDPQAAALHAAEHGEGEGWRSPVGPVVNTWAAQDPTAAANWSLSIDDPRQQSRSIGQVMRQWARDDPHGAANWIYSLDAGPSRDAAVAGLAQAIAGTDPQTALGWIATMNDDAARTRTLQRVSGAVMWRDPKNGAAMLQEAGLPAEQIRDPRRRRGRGD